MKDSGMEEVGLIRTSSGNLNDRIREIEMELQKYPRGYLVYKTIRDKKQPYLQWNEDGGSKSRYIKVGEREHIMEELERRDCLQRDLQRLKAYRDRLTDAWKQYPSLHCQSSLYKNVSIGYQSFAQMMEHDFFYVDKTLLIREWWEKSDQVTLITRPRRFGKTLNLDMMNCFFSVQYRGRADLFVKHQIWKVSEYHELQGTYPVICLSLAGVKTGRFADQVYELCEMIEGIYESYAFLADGADSSLSDAQRGRFCAEYEHLQAIVHAEKEPLDNLPATISSLRVLTHLLAIYYQKRVIILIDEYDTPLQEAWSYGSWDESMEFYRAFYNKTLKTNPDLEKAMMTGITRISQESLFSDLNHLEAADIFSNKYAQFFGFTEEEVFAALDSQGYMTHNEVKRWYDGFTFGEVHDIYNPWSIINYLEKGKFDTYWVNTSSNVLLSGLLARDDHLVRGEVETLLRGGAVRAKIDTGIVYKNLEQEENAVWSLMLATGYLKINRVIEGENLYGLPMQEYDLSLTNLEVRSMLPALIRGWFTSAGSCCNAFVEALLAKDVEAMNLWMNEIVRTTISVFDVGEKASRYQMPERFYHGFVLGLLVELNTSYELRSNRESGYGRYDVMLIPRNKSADAFILEFKVRSDKKEANLQETLEAAHRQMEERHYEAELLDRGIRKEKICRYALVFQGKNVLIG